VYETSPVTTKDEKSGDRVLCTETRGKTSCSLLHLPSSSERCRYIATPHLAFELDDKAMIVTSIHLCLVAACHALKHMIDINRRKDLILVFVHSEFR
jgi:hypothetical protein